MIKDKKALVFILIFSVFLILFESSVRKIISLNQAHLLMSGNPILKFQIVSNYGAAWGIFQNSKIFLIGFAILILILSLFYVLRNLCFDNKIEILSFALFIGGTLGNLIERLSLGHVVDYIKIVSLNFPIFNIFDTCIVCGILLFIINSLISKRNAE